MATSTQKTARQAYEKARAELASIETRLLSLTSDDPQFAASQEERARAHKSIAQAQRAALGMEGVELGDGFDLLSPSHPLLLLPVRIETRFAWTDGRSRRFNASQGFAPQLLVRVYPDEIHLDSHEPELTPGEQKAAAEFARAIRGARDLKDQRQVWGALIARVGANRASWIASLLAERRTPGSRPSPMSRPMHARLLPDRWVAFVDLPDGSTLTQRAPHPIQDPLETGPAAAGLQWMRNFDMALAGGMALIISLPPDTNKIRRLTVLGCRGTLDVKSSSEELQRLLQAHQYTRGLELLAPGVPTNSIPGARAHYTSRPEFETVFELEARRILIGGGSSPLCTPHDSSNGSRLADALGLPPSTFGFVRGADGDAYRDGVRMRSLLVRAVQRQLAALFDGILDAGMIESALAHATEWVDPLGSFAALRVGSQPYGLLPVQLRGERAPVMGFFPDDVRPLLDRLRSQFWEPAVAAVDRVGVAGADPGATLLGILHQDAVAREISFRPGFGPQLSAQFAAQLAPGAAAALTAQRATLVAVLTALGAPSAASAPLIDVLQQPYSVPLTAPLVQLEEVDDNSAQRARNYLEQIASMKLDELAAGTYAEKPNALLFALARLAMLEATDIEARELLRIGVPNIDMSRWGDENVPPMIVDSYGTLRRRLEMQVTLPDPLSTLGNTTFLWFHLAANGLHGGRLGIWRALLREMKVRPAAALEEALRGALGVFAHRLDAWYSSLATQDLMSRVRADPQMEVGINIGAWGVVEDLKLAPRNLSAANMYTDPANGGYIHAPSANHGAAAAVLRSIHLAHAAAGHGEAFSIDLSSERVRRATELLEGVRAGQPLGALIGYRLERALKAERIPQYIATLRKAAPIVANRLTTSTEPAEMVAANNTLDGLLLIEKAGYDGRTRADVATLWRNATLGALPNATEIAALTRVLDHAQDLADSVSDALLAESVYQAVQGSPLRAGATVDSASGASVPPTELDIARTPRTGVGVTHRVMLLLGEIRATGDTTDWAMTPRALAEPRIEACARALLPAPNDIGIRVLFRAADSEEVESRDTTLGDLHSLVPEEFAALRLAAIDLVAQADPHDTPHRSSLEVRLAALAQAAFADVTHTGVIELQFARAGTWDATRFGLIETLEIARTLRDVLGHGRSLGPRDFTQVVPDGTIGENLVDLARRLAGARAGLAAAKAQLSAALAGAGAGVLRAAIFAADLFGIAGAAPESLLDAPKRRDQVQVVARLAAQARAVVAEITARERKIDALPSIDVAACLQACFGDSFKVVTLLTAAANPFAAVPADATAPAVRSWFTRAARVRKGSQLLGAALGYAATVGETIGIASPTAWRVAQSGQAGERWAALPPAPGTSVPGGRVALAAVSLNSIDTDSFAGLFIDEWMDVIPSREETTSVAFHCDAPSAAAPQVMLLGVPPEGFERWTAQAARGVIDEALALSRIRLVDNDVLPGLGQLLPTLFAVESVTDEAPGFDMAGLTVPGVDNGN